MIFVFDRELNVIHNTSNSEDLISGEIIEQINGEHSCTITVPWNNMTQELYKEFNHVGFMLDGRFMVYTIRQLFDIKDGSADREIYCEHLSYELAGDIVEDRRVDNGTAYDIISRILSGTTWRVGNIAGLGNKTYNAYYISHRTALYEIAELYGGELQFRIELSEDKSRIENKYVDLLARRGEDTGIRFTFDNNLKKIEREVDTLEVYTQLIGRGHSPQTEDGGQQRRIQFTDVVWSKAKGDPADKPAGQNWIGHPEATEKYGIIKGVYEDESKTPEELLLNTWNSLVARANPTYTYKAELAFVKGLMDEGGMLRLGDHFVIIDDELGLELNTRIIEIKYNLLDLDSSTVTMGQFYKLIGDKSDIEKLQSQINNIRDKINNVDTSIDDTSFPDVLPSIPVPTVTSRFATIRIDWTYENKSYFEYALYGSRTKGFTPSNQNMLFRGQASSFLHSVQPEETWYYRLCVYNTHGNRTGYTNEFTGRSFKISEASDYLETASIGSALIGSLNADIINAGALKGQHMDMKNVTVTDGNGDRTFHVDSFGRVHINATSFHLTSKDTNLADKDYVDSAIDGVSIGNTHVILSNESQVIATTNNRVPFANQTFTTKVNVYQGSKEITNFTIGSISGANGISASVDQTNKTVKFTVSTSTTLTADNGSFTIPIVANGLTISKRWTWAVSKQGNIGPTGPTGATGPTGPAGPTGATGPQGAGAKTVDIIASSQVFKSTDGGTTFSPDTITLTPKLQSVNYSNWQYSTNGGSSWGTVTSGQNGLSISGNVLSISKNSSLFTKTVTTVVFRVNTNDSSIYDTMSIVKLYDVTDLEIGGRNYIRDYKFERSDIWKKSRAEAVIDTANKCGYLTATTANPHLNQTFDPGLFGVGDVLTLQYEIKCEGVSANTGSDSFLIRTQLSGYNTNGNFVRDVAIFGKHESNNDFSTYTDWTKIVKTMTVTGASDFNHTALRLYARNFKGKIYFRNVKLERGNKATDLSPAPEDMENVAQDVVNNQTQLDIFNKLTNNGQTQGIYLENNKVYINGQYIKAGTITANMITSGTFKGTNFIAGGSSNNGYVEVLDNSNNVIFKAQKDGIVSRKITFVNNVNSGFGGSTPIVTSISQDGINMGYRTGTSSDGFNTSYDKETRYASDEVRMSYRTRGENSATGSTTYHREETMSLTPKTVHFEILADDGSGMMTSGLFKKSAVARGTGIAYQAGISVGYYESLMIGSSLHSLNDDGGLGRGAGAEIFAEIDSNGLMLQEGVRLSNSTDGNRLKIQGQHGNVTIGSYNTDWCHFNTDRPRFYFDKQVSVCGEIYAGGGYDQRVYHQGWSPRSGNYWSGGATFVNTDGVMEIGKYIDFHNSNSTTADYDNRITSNGNTLEFSGNIKTVGSIYVRESRVATQADHGGLDLGGTDRNTAICSANVPTWWNGANSYKIYTAGSKPTPAEIGALGNSGSQTIHVAQGKFAIAGNNNLGHIDVQGGFHTRGDSNDIWFERHIMPASWSNASLFLGYSDKRWKALYASNGTIQTSDERFKVKRGFANIDDCFDMIKNTELYKYVMLDQNKEDLSRNRLGKLAMEGNEDNVRVHMGIMAQDLQKYECGKHILVEGEYDRADGTKDTMLHVNPHDMTMAVMGGLKKEIEIREEQIRSLEARVAKLESLLKSMIENGGNAHERASLNRGY